MTYQSEDIQIYNDLIETVRRKSSKTTPIGDLMIIVGTYFLGFPYTGNTLEEERAERLVINLRQFDCFTFVENTAVLARLIRKGKIAFNDYAAAIKRIRYRNGRVSGYPSRLHYYSDWLADNEKKGIVRSITHENVGKPLHKEINFMTTHRDDYHGLRSDRSFKKMAVFEKNLSEHPLYYIPKDELKQYEDIIENGDMIAVTTGIEGLDVMHVGLAVFLARGIHLLHASEIEKQVVISNTSLFEYLSERKTMTGIMVGRVQEVCQSDDNL
ncbi:MAG: N-acetylmuramoyl-L-alanine amidase-like domain-containing protein [Syntrophaceae bacterium]